MKMGLATVGAFTLMCGRINEVPMTADPNEEAPRTITRGGRDLACPHCKNDKFYQRSGLLNTSGMSFMNLDWLNRSATNYICSICGRVEWFTTLIGEGSTSSSTDGDSECLSCGEVIPHGKAACPKCGWTYVS